jgi:ribosomal protein L44E
MLPDVLTSAPEMAKRTAITLKCDFCGAEAPRVRRVALDEGYDRLGQRHVVRYACERCSREKEAARGAKVDARQKPL